MSEELITIPLSHYKSLQERDDKLCALEAGGVDNWSGYEDAMTFLEEVDEDE